MTRMNRKVGHELVGMARVLLAVNIKGEMCRVEKTWKEKKKLNSRDMCKDREGK